MVHGSHLFYNIDRNCEYYAHFIFGYSFCFGYDGEDEEHVILEREANAIQLSIDELEEFRSMFGIGTHSASEPRGKEIFMGGTLAKDHEADDTETCIKRRVIILNNTP